MDLCTLFIFTKLHRTTCTIVQYYNYVLKNIIILQIYSYKMVQNPITQIFF